MANESFVSTSQSFEAVSNHLALINQSIRRATPAVVDVEASIPVPIKSEIRINAGLVFSVPGSDGAAVTYELFSAPNDFITPIIIPPGKRELLDLV